MTAPWVVVPRYATDEIVMAGAGVQGGYDPVNMREAYNSMIEEALKLRPPERRAERQRKRPPSMRALLRRLDEFEAVVRAHEMRGTNHPYDITEIETDYEQTKENFIATLRSLVILAEN